VSSSKFENENERASEIEQLAAEWSNSKPHRTQLHTCSIEQISTGCNVWATYKCAHPQLIVILRVLAWWDPSNLLTPKMGTLCNSSCKLQHAVCVRWGLCWFDRYNEFVCMWLSAHVSVCMVDQQLVEHEQKLTMSVTLYTLELRVRVSWVRVGSVCENGGGNKKCV